MNEVTSDQELDQLVWSIIKDSRNPLDYLDYLRHILNRPGEQAQAFKSASQYWPDRGEIRHIDRAFAALEKLAHEGNEFAMFHLGRWHSLGYGVPVDSNKGMNWYQRGAEAGSSRCLINVAKYTVKDDVQAAIAMYKKAAEELGDLSAHCFWADVDKKNYNHHLEIGASSGDSFAMYCLAFERLKHLEEHIAVEPWVELLKRSADKGESYVRKQGLLRNRSPASDRGWHAGFSKNAQGSSP